MQRGVRTKKLSSKIHKKLRENGVTLNNGNFSVVYWIHHAMDIILAMENAQVIVNFSVDSLSVRLFIKLLIF